MEHADRLALHFKYKITMYGIYLLDTPKGTISLSELEKEI